MIPIKNPMSILNMALACIVLTVGHVSTAGFEAPLVYSHPWGSKCQYHEDSGFSCRFWLRPWSQRPCGHSISERFSFDVRVLTAAHMRLKNASCGSRVKHARNRACHEMS